ncbi:MAG: transcription antitermination factor NusB [Acidobacteria bacterium]|nr:transcription antitermination factor NusB [Acidobacteriota bacterium]
MGARRKARECALQLLFQADLSPMSVSEFHDIYWRLHPKSPEIRKYADFLFLGTLAHRTDIDALVQKYSEHWRIERMAAVDRNILRMAVFEFLHEQETPTTVVINEALEIARKFSTEESTQFINGILDAINKHYLPGKDDPTLPDPAGGETAPEEPGSP